jgi:hypothetical protein
VRCLWSAVRALTPVRFNKLLIINVITYVDTAFGLDTLTSVTVSNSILNRGELGLSCSPSLIRQSRYWSMYFAHSGVQ